MADGVLDNLATIDEDTDPFKTKDGRAGSFRAPGRDRPGEPSFDTAGAARMRVVGAQKAMDEALTADALIGGYPIEARPPPNRCSGCSRAPGSAAR